MAGIAIIYDPANKETQALVTQMCLALQRSDREGPVEWYSRPGMAIGRCRSLLINRASQPAWNEEQTVGACFHGELFGYQDLKRSLERKGHQFSADSHAEFVVHLYEDRGDAFIHELNGGFALALWDSGQQRLIIANDRYGLRPLYAAQCGGKHLWASAPKAILADATFSRQINLAAMADFMCLGIPQSNDTMFAGIDELPAASLVTCQEGQVHCRQYWDLSLQEEETGISAQDYLDELIPLLEQAAERRQRGKLSLGLLLSGGVDSRNVLSVLRKDDLKTFTYGPPLCDDVRLARLAAQAANVSHLTLEIRPDYLETFAQVGIERTEDLISCGNFHSISVYDEMASHVNALTTGSTGEVIFGRVNRSAQDLFLGDGFSVDRYYDSYSIMTDEELEQLVKPAYFQQMKGLARARFGRDFDQSPSRRVAHKIDYWIIRQKHRRFTNRLASLFPDNLEYRPLFFDKDVIDFAQTISPSLRWGENSVYKQVMLRAAPELAGIPATTTQGLPPAVPYTQMVRLKRRRARWRRWRRKIHTISRGLIPPTRSVFYVNYAEWLKLELRDWAKSILLDPRTLHRDYWNPSAITRLLEAHLRGQPSKRPDRKLNALISFELWHRTYLDACDTSPA